MREPPDPPAGRQHLLTSQVGQWRITLTDGSSLSIAAHAYHENDGVYVFSILMAGTPPYEVDVATIPAEKVSTIFGG